MKVAITDGKGGLWPGTAPVPEIGPYDCLVQVESCAFCNSTDRHIVNGTPPFDGTFPAILGHESVGIVQKSGSKVQHFAVGDRVMRPMAIWGNETLGGLSSMWGGFAEYGKIRDAQAMVKDGRIESVPHHHGYQQTVPHDIDLDRAMLMTSQKEIWSSVKKMGTISGRRFLVAGVGIVGCLFGIFLRMKGAGHVTVTARRKEPLDFAMARGAADSASLLADVSSEYDALVETTGSLKVALGLLPAIRDGGHVYGYAVYAGQGDDSRYDIFRDRHVFERINPDEKSAHDEICQMIREHKIETPPFISHRFPIEELSTAWKTVIEKKTLKTVIMFCG